MKNANSTSFELKYIAVSKTIAEKINWGVSTFQPYYSPKPDCIYSVILQKRLDIKFQVDFPHAVPNQELCYSGCFIRRKGPSVRKKFYCEVSRRATTNISISIEHLEICQYLDKAFPTQGIGRREAQVRFKFFMGSFKN